MQRCRYYTRLCKKPVNRASLHLVVKAGSVLEEEHERGVAHIVEHLAFNATEVHRLCPTFLQSMRNPFRNLFAGSCSTPACLWSPQAWRAGYYLSDRSNVAFVMQAHANHGVIEILEQVGCEFGPCQNAYTGLEETVYELVIPTDDASVLPQALNIFREFAFKIRCASVRLRRPPAAAHRQ